MEDRLIISLKPDTQITEVLDMLETHDAAQVEIHAPQGTEIFSDALNLRILKRESEHLHKRLTIVSEDEPTLALAKRAGLAVKTPESGEEFFTSWKKERAIPANEKKRYLPEGGLPSHRPKMTDIIAAPRPRATPSAIVPSRDVPRHPSPLPESEALPVSTLTDTKENFAEPEVTAARERSPGERRPRALIFGAAVVLAGAFLLVTFIKPKARITVFPKKEQAEFEMEMQARLDVKSPQPQKTVMPLEQVSTEIEERREFPATGEKDLTDRARGRITIFNTYNTRPQGLVATTRFLSENGKIFRIPKAVVVPGATIENGKLVAGKISAEVLAAEAGDTYNIPPGRFTIPGFSGTPKFQAFYATSDAPMSGGFTGKAKVVTRNDVERARNALLSAAKSKAESDLRAKFPPDLLLVDGALATRIVDSSATPAEGERGDSFTYRVKVHGDALLIREQDAWQILEPQLKIHLDVTRTIRSETRKITYVLRDADIAGHRMNFVTRFSATAEAVIDQEKIRAGLVGMRLDATKEFFLQEPGIDRADISLWPFWARRLPNETGRILIKIGETDNQK